MCNTAVFWWKSRHDVMLKPKNVCLISPFFLFYTRILLHFNSINFLNPFLFLNSLKYKNSESTVTLSRITGRQHAKYLEL